MKITFMVKTYCAQLNKQQEFCLAKIWSSSPIKTINYVFGVPDYEGSMVVTISILYLSLLQKRSLYECIREYLNILKTNCINFSILNNNLLLKNSYPSI